jgi:hypothetical protein
VEARPSFPGGLFHWIDALAGTSAGKTNAAHLEQYVKRFGPLGRDDKIQIAAFVEARAEHLGKLREAAARGGAPARGSALLGVFCASATVDDALAAVKGELAPATWNGLAGAIEHFRPKYEAIWDDGAIPKSFLDRARRDPSLGVLEDLLAKIVRFYDVDPLAAPPPRLALVPVPAGYGTHAEAIGGVLLIEIRPGDALADEASVIVHETSHFLWSLVPGERQQRLARYAAGLDERAAREFALLGEAIPTALGQGVADRSFRPAQWSPGGPWYHTLEVDTCARRIFPIVAYALEAGLTFDEPFLARLFRPTRPSAAPRDGGRRFLVWRGAGPYIASRVGPADACGTLGRGKHERQNDGTGRRPDRAAARARTTRVGHLLRRQDHPGARRRLRIS